MQVTAAMAPSHQKQLKEDLKTHFTDDGPTGRKPGKGSKHWICKYCETRFDGTASHLRTHFLKKCSLDLLTRLLSVEERARRAEGIRMGKALAELIERGEKSSTPTSNLPSASSLVTGAMGACSGAADAGGVPLRVATSGECGRAAPQTGRPMRQTLIEDADSIITRNEHTSRFLDNFLFCMNQPFSLVDNEYFLGFIDAVKKAHPSWLPYHRDDARTRRLDSAFGRTRADVTAMTTKWQVTGCMLQMDGWSDRRNRPHLNVMVSSPIGTVFWKSVCMEGKDKDSAAYFKILDGVIKEIGSNTVVGVVMDNARVCVKAGKMVEAAYPQIFRVGCTTHALDLALEDMYKQLGWLAVVVDADNVVGKFFTNVDKARALFDKFSPNLKLKRPAVTRFATSHDMLASLKRGRNALEKCVCDTMWVDKMVRADQLAAFREVTSIVLGRDGFWDKVEKALAVMSPVVELLHLVDGPGATMSKVCFKMDALVERMHGLKCVTPGEKADIEDILMHRWSFMTSELHCAAAFLDPKFRHSALAERDREPQAVKLLGQASSSAACERNWSLHELIFGRRRMKLMPERLSKLVFNNSNTQLIRSCIRGGKEEVHIPWEDDRPVQAEVEEWYNTWVATAVSNDDDAADTLDDAEVGEEDGDEPLMRTWLRNDEWDDQECEAEDIDLVGSREKDWHECTKPGRYRERELRRKSGNSQPYREASGSRKRGKKRAQREEVEEAVPVAKGRRADGEPKRKRGRPSNAELAERKTQKAEAIAAKAAAAAAAARSAAARKGRKKKARSNVIDDDESGDDVAAADDNEAAAAGEEAAAAPSSASSSSSSDDEDASGSGAESMEHGEGDGDGTGDSSEGSEGQSREEEEGDGGEE
ncbi:hypothetical protein CBR_g38073 [Chara braunii]|uniref:DUF659 domain-containing protein n=1 Tax=Chara braunii TaxID=69332 RepID=A0A388K0H1_CHABU|nr:hypothetical protein CBR_g38073 [Chara braunii]|eukprot:GBG63453.1 hypothetical protein CBR_g38073 [Chara braunii]